MPSHYPFLLFSLLILLMRLLEWGLAALMAGYMALSPGCKSTEKDVDLLLDRDRTVPIEEPVSLPPPVEAYGRDEPEDGLGLKFQEGIAENLFRLGPLTYENIIGISLGNTVGRILFGNLRFTLNINYFQ